MADLRSLIPRLQCSSSCSRRITNSVAVIHFLFVTLLTILLVWGLRLYRLNYQSLWYDEGYTAFVAGIPSGHTRFSDAMPPGWGRSLMWWTTMDFMPPLYYIVQALWLPLAGWTEFAVRFLSVWTGTMLVAVLIRLGKDVQRPWGPGSSECAGIIVGLLAGLSPFYVWYSQEARMYMFQGLFSILGTLFLLRALRNPMNNRLWWGVVIMDALTLYSHTASVLFLLYHACVVMVAVVQALKAKKLHCRSPLSVLRLEEARGLGALAGAGLVWMPWLVYALRSGYGNASVGYVPGRIDWQYTWQETLRVLVTGRLVDKSASNVTVTIWGLAILIGLLVMILLKPRRRRSALFLVACFVVPVGTMAWIVESTTITKFAVRYLTIAAPPLFLLPAIGIASLFTYRPSFRSPTTPRIYRLMRAAVALSILAVLITSIRVPLHNLYFDPSYARPDFRKVACFVQEHRAPDDVVFLLPANIYPVWQFYAGTEGWAGLANDPTVNLRSFLYYRNTFEDINRALLDGKEHPGVWLVGWHQLVNDPTDMVPYLLTQIGDEQPITIEASNMSVRYYQLHANRLPLPPEPIIPIPLGRSFEEIPLTVVGCDMPAQVAGDEVAPVTCFWQATGKLPQGIGVSVRLMDTSGIEWARNDFPISGYLETNRWPLNEIVIGRYMVRLPVGIPPGDFYQIHMIVHGSWGTDKVAVGRLTVGRSISPFTAILPNLATRSVALGNGGLVLEAASIQPDHVLPGEEIQVEAVWHVNAVPFTEPELWLIGQEPVSLLPAQGTTGIWKEGDRYHTITRIPVSPYIQGGTSKVMAIGDVEVTVGSVQINITRAFTMPPGVSPLDYRLGDSIRLVGTELSTITTNTVEVTLYWQAEEFTDQSYTVFVHLFDSSGALCDQRDTPPRAGTHPTNHWLPGEVISDTYPLKLPADLPPGEYRIMTGMYTWPTLERLSATDASGTPVPDNTIPVATFHVP